MGDIEVVEGEVVPDADVMLPAVRDTPSVTLFRSDDPQVIVERATAIADVLSKVLRDRKLTTTINRREHVRVEGWTLCGSMLGVFPIVVWTRKIENGWEARAEARTLDGQIVGAAEAECLELETTWGKRDDYARRSMAQTRAQSKALRGPLGFIVSLAGFDATPEEEMPGNAREAPLRQDDPKVKVPRSFAEAEEMLSHYGQPVVDDYKRFAKEAKAVGGAKFQEVQMVVVAICERFDPGALPGPDDDAWRSEWAKVLNGVILEPATAAVDDGPSDAALTAEQQQELDDLAAQAADADISFGTEPE